ncbi:restriction endonuclease subunit S [Streptococcus sp. HMSC071D03]|uniref:restriction endonuclease subunit S n=1 Tax=Streptococcus sp. HMSC071D03 TaxID=1739341 RepID=UPI0009F24232|nr:restriction endonuclease subunit S [Streptococcus sp. HMSC071D03]
MKKVKLGEICEIQAGGTPSRNKQEFWVQGNIPWVKIKDINSKYISKVEEHITDLGLRFSSAKLFSRGTILYTIFATIGEVAILDIDAATNQAIAGLHLKSEKVLKEYLYFFLLSIKNRVKNDSRGVAQNNINLTYLKNIEVPIVENSIQQEICNNLTKINQIITLRNQQLIELSNLVKSRFNEMFGDPVLNEMGWEIETLNKIGTIGRGVSKHRPRNASELFGGIYPFIQTGDVANSGNYIVDYHSTYSEFGLKQSKLWDKGTLCITIAANIAKTSILAFDSCFPDSIVGFIPGERTNNMFIHYWFSYFQKILESQAPESAQKNINLKILSELKVILPPLSLQNEFADFVAQVDKSQFTCQMAIKLWRNSLKSSII